MSKSKFTPTADEVTELRARLARERPDLDLSRSLVRDILETYMFERALYGRTLQNPVTGESQCPSKMPKCSPGSCPPKPKLVARPPTA